MTVAVGAQLDLTEATEQTARDALELAQAEVSDAVAVRLGPGSSRATPHGSWSRAAGRPSPRYGFVAYQRPWCWLPVLPRYM